MAADRDVDFQALERQRQEALGLAGGTRLRTPTDAERFLERAGIALRYGATRGLPLASLYRAAAGPAPTRFGLTHASALTNHLLGAAVGIEVEVIADRLTLVHRSLMPVLYVLVRRGQAVDDLSGLSLNARAAHRLIRQCREVTAGQVRRELGLGPARAKSDPAYEALGELRRRLLVDRGPFEVNRTGIPYLSKEGYPYHFFQEAHADLVAASRRYSFEQAAERFIAGYLRAAVFCSIRTLASMFQACLTRAELDAALERLSGRRGVLIRPGPRGAVAVSTAKRLA